MVLFVGENHYSLGSVNLDTFANWISSLTIIKEEINSFRCRKVVVNSENSLLYVHQGEMAVVRQHTNDRSHRKQAEKRLPRSLGADDATSCYIVVIYSEKICSIAHLDCVQRVMSFFNIFEGYGDEITERKLTVHIVGGFPDSRDNSNVTCRAILTELLSATDVYHLGVFCVGDNNTHLLPAPFGLSSKLVEQPIVLGVLFDRNTKQLCPASFTWEARGPLPALRLSRLSHSLSFTEAIEVFDTESGLMIVKPLTYVVDPSRKLRPLTLDIMRSSSTTPDQEPLTYFEGQYAMNRLAIQCPDPMKTWFINGALSFELRMADPDEYHWLPCDEDSQLAHECSLNHVVPGVIPLV